MNIIIKILLHILCIGSIFAVVFGFSACEEAPPPTPECKHSYGNWQMVKTPSCQEEGLEMRICEFDRYHIEERKIEKIGHSFENYVPNGDATCRKSGTKTACCSTPGCNARDTVNLSIDSRLPHNFNQKTVHDDYFFSGASCTKKAKYYYSCECGEAAEETFEVGDYGHSFGLTALFDNNNHWYECEFCKEKRDVSSHKWNDGELLIAPTCSADGKIVYKCECGAKEEYTLSPTHILTYVAASPSTCTVEGNVEYWQCCASDCGKKFSDANGENEISSTIIPTLSHKYDTWIYDELTHHKKCTSCDKTTESTSHVTENGYDSEYHYLVCECGYKMDKVAHTAIVKCNGEEHWFECTVCEYLSEKQDHKQEWQNIGGEFRKICPECNYVFE